MATKKKPNPSRRKNKPNRITPPAWIANAERFEPRSDDANDLAWYFAHGPTEQWLTKDLRRRHRRIARCLDGRGQGLCLYYQSTDDWFGFRLLALLPVLVNDTKLEELERTITRVKQDATHGAGTTPERAAVILDLFAHCVARLNFEYQIYLENTQKPYDSFKPFVEISRSSLEGIIGLIPADDDDGEVIVFRRRKRRLDYPKYRHPAVLVDQLLRDGSGDFSSATFGGVRITPNGARFLFDRQASPYGLDPSDRRVLEALAACAKTATSPPVELTMTTLERSNRIAARERMTAEEIAEWVQDAIEQTREIRRSAEPGARQSEFGISWLKELEVSDHALVPGFVDPRYTETNPERGTTSVSEVAKSVDLPNAWVRPELVKRACPGARDKRGEIPVAWLHSDQGRDFQAAAERERNARRARRQQRRRPPRTRQ